MDLTINIENPAATLLQAAIRLLRGESPRPRSGAGGHAAESRSAAEARYLQLVEAHGNLISRVCYYYSQSLQDYEDLRQDCLINIWRGLPGFDSRSSVATWLYRVCINTCITSWRGGGRRDTVPLRETDLPGDDAEDREQAERIDRLYALISLLPLVDRGIVMMWLDGHDYDEIAQTTGITKSNVAVRLHRIRKRLKVAAENKNI